MINYKRGSVVLLPFPFTDLSSTKQRPALVIKSIATKHLPILLIVAMITSQIEGEQLPGDSLIKDWQKANLLYPSKVRLAKLVSIEKNLIIKKIGILSTQDQSTISSAWRKLFRDWCKDE